MSNVVRFTGAGCRTTQADRYAPAREEFLKALLPKMASLNAFDRFNELRALRAEMDQIVALASMCQ